MGPIYSKSYSKLGRETLVGLFALLYEHKRVIIIFHSLQNHCYIIGSNFYFNLQSYSDSSFNTDIDLMNGSAIIDGDPKKC